MPMIPFPLSWSRTMMSTSLSRHRLLLYRRTTRSHELVRVLFLLVCSFSTMMKEKKKEKEKNLNEKTRRFDGCSKLQDASKLTTLLLGAEAQARHLTASETIPT